MRILIVGAGVAGMTLNALLCRRGVTAAVIERTDVLNDFGYMLGLFPIGSNVLHGLGCHPEYIDLSEPCDSYEAWTSSHLIKQFSLKQISEQYGPYQNITRHELIQLMYHTCRQNPIRFGTTVTALKDKGDEVVVSFNKGDDEVFDCVVIADGIHSHTRKLLWSESEYKYFNTGWGAWVWWCSSDLVPQATMQEFWGVGTFCGLYPVKGKVGVVAGVDSSSEEEALKDQSGRKEFIFATFDDMRKTKPAIFDALPDNDEPVFYWSLSDQRTNAWVKNRVVLLGDAACAFLPTAGVGASMAMGSAAALSDELSRTDATWVASALQLFEKRRRKKVEAAQTDSRNLAKLMFVNNKLMAFTRDKFTQMMSSKSLIKSIVKGFDEPI